jgi:cytochrome c peroxidase
MLSGRDGFAQGCDRREEVTLTIGRRFIERTTGPSGLTRRGLDPAVANLQYEAKAYRTTPLRALWQHPYFHDGRAATLADVVADYNRVRKLGLTAEQQRELVEYLKSL